MRKQIMAWWTKPLTTTEGTITLEWVLTVVAAAGMLTFLACVL